MLTIEPRARSQQASPKPHYRRGGVVILIPEDSHACGRAAQLLEAHGFHVLVARTPDLHRRLAATREPDAVLTVASLDCGGRTSRGPAAAGLAAGTPVFSLRLDPRCTVFSLRVDPRFGVVPTDHPDERSADALGGVEWLALAVESLVAKARAVR